MWSSMIRGISVCTIACLCGFALIGAPGRGQAAGPTTLSIAVGIDADTLDPEGQTTTTVANMVDYMFDPLVWYNGQRTGLHGRPPYTAIEPVLATSWTVSPDGRTYTFKLRQGVKFQDGTEFNADAVRANIDRWLDPEVRNPSRYYWDAIDANRIDTPDPYTVVLHLRRPDPTLLEKLATTAAEIVSPTAVKKLDNGKIALGPVDAGTGPYVFKEWVHGDHITLVRNPTYWGRKPYFDQVVFRVVPNAGTRETMLRAGDVQMAFEPPAPPLPPRDRGAERPRHLHRPEQSVRSAQGRPRAPGAQLRYQQERDHRQRFVRPGQCAPVPNDPIRVRLRADPTRRLAVQSREGQTASGRSGVSQRVCGEPADPHRPVHPGLSVRAGDRGPAGQRRRARQRPDGGLADLHRLADGSRIAFAAPDVRPGLGDAVPRCRRRAVWAVLVQSVAAVRPGVDVLQGSAGGQAAGGRADDRGHAAAARDLPDGAAADLDGRALGVSLVAEVLRRDEQPSPRRGHHPHGEVERALRNMAMISA